MRLRALLACALLLTVLAPSAAAQRGTTVRLDGLQDGAVVSGTMPLSIHASATSGVRRLLLTIDGEIVVDESPNNLRQELEAAYTWDTTHYVSSPGLSRNRKYVVKVRAVSNGGSSDEITATAVVNNQPATPIGLSGATNGRTVILGWEANPEPDIIGYRVESYFGSEYLAVDTVTETAFEESRNPGRYSYRVIALRHSEVAPSGVESIATEPVTVTIAGAARGSTGGAGGARGTTKGSAKGGKDSAGTVGATGLPGGVALPGSRGLGGVPELPAPEWGTYKKRLPYQLPKGGVPLQASAVSRSAGPITVIPPDGLRWVAMGLLLLAIAGLSRLLALRITPLDEPAQTEA